MPPREFSELPRDGDRGGSGVRGAMGVHSDEPPGETPTEVAFAEPLVGGGPEGMEIDGEVQECDDDTMGSIGSLEPACADYISQLMIEQLVCGKQSSAIM